MSRKDITPLEYRILEHRTVELLPEHFQLGRQLQEAEAAQDEVAIGQLLGALFELDNYWVGHAIEAVAEGYVDEPEDPTQPITIDLTEIYGAVLKNFVASYLSREQQELRIGYQVFLVKTILLSRLRDGELSALNGLSILSELLKKTNASIVSDPESRKELKTLNSQVIELIDAINIGMNLEKDRQLGKRENRDSKEV